MLAQIESIFDDLNIQCRRVEQEYFLPSHQTQLKDIQFRMQRVFRLIQVKILVLFIRV